MNRKAIFFIFIAVITSVSLFAQETTTSWGIDGAYYLDDNKGFNTNLISYTPELLPDGYTLAPGDSGRDLGTGWGGAEAMAQITHRIKVPFMAGPGILTKGNNITYTFKGTLSPVSINAIAYATLTPIAFLNFQAGTSAGTGWNFFGLFNGLGLNTDGTGTPSEDSLSGLVLKPWLSGTFQFDFGAVFPGKWNHVLIATTAKLGYKYFTAAGPDDPWQYEADAGDNYNGFSYYGTYVLGYSLPFKVNTVAFMVETEQNLFENKTRSEDDPVDWGSDFVEVTFGPLINIKLSEDSNVIILAQFSREKDYSDDTIFNNYFLNREYSEAYIDFKRIAFSYSRKF